MHKALSQIIREPTAIDRLLRSCNPGLFNLQPAEPTEMWSYALDRIAAKGCLRELFTLLADEESPALNDILADIVNATEAGRADEGFVHCDQVFVNRKKLHLALQRLAPPESAFRVLLVRGDEQGGKSWTRHVVNAYARSLGHACTYVCQGLIGSVDDVLEMIFAGFGKPAPPRDSTDDAWFGKACRALIRHSVEAKAPPRWIVVDDLGTRDGQPLLDPQIRRLCDQIVLHMQDPQFAHGFRLVLIGYPDGPLPTRWQRCWLEDRTSSADIDAAEVSDFLCRWARRNDKNLPREQADLLAAKVLDIAESARADDARPRLGRIHDELHDLLETL